MGEGRDETGLVRAARWRVCDAKDSCSCASTRAGAALLRGRRRRREGHYSG